MSDLKTLHDAWGTPEAPSRAAYSSARAALLERAGRRRRRFGLSGLGVRIAVVGAVALVVLSVVGVAENLGGTGADVPDATAAVLERAAVAVEQKPFTAPRDDQWIYVEDRITLSDGKTETLRGWRRADGMGMAWIENGRLRVEIHEPRRDPRSGRPIPGVFEGYKEMAALPTDPNALLRWAYQRAENITGAGMNEHGDVYLMFNHMLRENVLPPELEAAIFRALKQIPGVTVLDTVDVAGRPAIALGLGTSDWLHEELLLDKETYAYRGERSTVVRDAIIDPLKAGNARGEVKKGSKVVVERVVTAIVDEPGQRR
jgi:hypothetical protein